jgi:Adenylate and Guanylate cyclase catalytic domain
MSQSPTEVSMSPVNYIYLDVVDFSKDRSVESQSEIIAQLNWLVKHTLEMMERPIADCILLPTGDGLCICILGQLNPYDALLSVARHVLRLIDEQNRKTEDPTLKFEVRIGLNYNVDNVVTDINGNRNVAGAGINIARRIMDFGDGSQILVGRAIYEQLSPRRQYMQAFRYFPGIAKHDTEVPVYQFIEKDQPGLNVDIPDVFRNKTTGLRPMSEFVAFYIATAYQNRSELLIRSRDSESVLESDAVLVLLYFRALDNQEAFKSNKFNAPLTLTWGAGVKSFDEQLQHYKDQDTWVIQTLARLIVSNFLTDYSDNFEDTFPPGFVFVKDNGLSRVRETYPRIWTFFNFD